MTRQEATVEVGVCRPAIGGRDVAGQAAPRRPTVRRDGEAIVIDIPMTFRRRSGRKEIVLPEGATAGPPPRPPSPLALAVARAFRWEEMIESGEAVSNSDLARRLKIDQSFIARTVRLASLAPDIVEAILDGQEPDEASLRRLRQTMPLLWAKERELFHLGHDPSESAVSTVSTR
jgi:hypothetical protein